MARAEWKRGTYGTVGAGALLLLAAVGCGGSEGGGGDDAGIARRDSGGTIADGGPSVSDAGAATDAGTMPARDGGAMRDAGEDAHVVGSDAGPAGVDAGSDAGADAGCAGESDGELCASHAFDCGSAMVTDRCGAMRTVECGSSCVAPRTCGGAGASNHCGCAAPTDPTSVSCSISAGHIRARFTGVSTSYMYVYRTGSVAAPTRCDITGAVTATGTVGMNSLLLAGGPAVAGECGNYRLCTVFPECTADFSPGVVLHVCVDAVGDGTCTVM